MKLVLLLSTLIPANANLCGVVSSVIPGQSYPANWPWIEITDHGEIGVLVNFGNNLLSSPANNSVSSHPIPNAVSGYGEVGLYSSDNFIEAICLDKVDVSLYDKSDSTRCAVVTLSDDKSKINSQNIVITLPENDENCMDQIVSNLYATEVDIIARRYANRHVCLNRNIKRNGFTPIFCQSWTSGIGYQWNMAAYAGPIGNIGNRIKSSLTLAWLTDTLSMPIGSTSSIPFDDLATVCCENITLYNKLPSDGIYTRSLTKCNRNPLETFVNQFKKHIGHNYGFSLNEKVMERIDGLWSIFVVELNFFKYFFVLPTNCDDDANLQVEGTIRSNDHFVDSACIENTSKSGFDYFTQGNWTTGMRLDIACGVTDLEYKSTQSDASTDSPNTTELTTSIDSTTTASSCTSIVAAMYTFLIILLN